MIEMRVRAGDHTLGVGRGVAHRVDRVAAEFLRAVPADPQDVAAVLNLTRQIDVAVAADGHDGGRAVKLRILARDGPLEHDRPGRQGHRQQRHGGE